MYELYLADEALIPVKKQLRYKNFHTQSIKENPLPVSTTATASVPRPPSTPKKSAQIILPDEVMEVLKERDITEIPYIFIRSNLCNATTDGEAYAIGFKEFVVLLWRQGDEQYKFIKFENYEIVDVSGGIEDSDESIITLMISTELKTVSLWFRESQTDELVNFINSWKYHQIHYIGGKTDIRFDDDGSTYSPIKTKLPNLPEIDTINQKDLPRTVIFGTLLIDQVADGHNITELDLEYLNMILTNPDLFALCIRNFKRDVALEAKEVVKIAFSEKQKLMLLINMADLAYRNGEEHSKEIKAIHNFAAEINFPIDKITEILYIFKVKNDPMTLEVY